MKKMRKKLAAICTVAVVAIAAMFLLTACTAIKVGGSFTLNEDGSGSRVIEGLISKTDESVNAEGLPDAVSRNFLKIHGAELQTWLQTTYTEKVADSESWLTIAVDDTAADFEKIRLSFDFTSFDDYLAKMGQLAQFGAAELPSTYKAPTFVTDDDGISTYTETPSVLKTIFGSLLDAVMADETVFDITAGGTNEGEPRSGYPYTESDIRGYAVEAGTVSYKLGQNAAVERSPKDADVVITVRMDGSSVTKETKKIIEYTFEDNLNNTGTDGATYNLTKGAESTGGAFAEGISGKGYQFDGTTYLQSSNLSLFLENATISLYYKATAWTDTDTGANIAMVTAGLGALNAGALDVGFAIDKTDAQKPVTFLSKTNGTDWQQQDKMQTETYFNNRLNEWHNFTAVYDYDSTEKVGYVYLYIDGERIGRMEQYNMAGLPLCIGKADESEGGIGGFNIGGYIEAGIVKRGLTGVLDNLCIYDGALSAEEVKAIYDANPVSAPYDAEDESNTTLTGGGQEPAPTNPEKKGCGSAVLPLVGGSAAAMLAFGTGILGIAFLVTRRRNRNKAKQN